VRSHESSDDSARVRAWRHCPFPSSATAHAVGSALLLVVVVVLLLLLVV
jgi:hypothetical protein